MGILSMDDSQFHAALRRADRATDQWSRSVGRMLTGGVVAGFAAATAASVAFGVALKKSIDAAAGLQSMNAEFETMLGSATKARNLVAQINKLAALTPYGTSGLTGTVKTMMAFGVESEKAIDFTRMLGDIAGSSQQRLDSLGLAFSQAFATGRLMGQDLLQMINAGFNPLQEMSRTTGRPVGELKKEMEAGKITIDMVIAAFKSATSAGGRFFGNMERQSKTWNGMLATLEDNWQMFLAAFGAPVIDKLSPVLAGWIEKLDDLNSMAPELGQALVDDISAVFEDQSIAGAMAEMGGKLVRVMAAAAMSMGDIIAASLTNAFEEPIARFQARIEEVATLFQTLFSKDEADKAMKEAARLESLAGTRRSELEMIESRKPGSGSKFLGISNEFSEEDYLEARARKLKEIADIEAKRNAAFDRANALGGSAAFDALVESREERVARIKAEGVRTGFGEGLTAEERVQQAMDRIWKATERTFPKVAEVVEEQMERISKEAEFRRQNPFITTVEQLGSEGAANSWDDLGSGWDRSGGLESQPTIARGLEAMHAAREARGGVQGAQFNDGNGSRIDALRNGGGRILAASESLLLQPSRVVGGVRRRGETREEMRERLYGKDKGSEKTGIDKSNEILERIESSMTSLEQTWKS